MPVLNMRLALTGRIVPAGIATKLQFEVPVSPMSLIVPVPPTYIDFGMIAKSLLSSGVTSNGALAGDLTSSWNLYLSVKVNTPKKANLWSI